MIVFRSLLLVAFFLQTVWGMAQQRPATHAVKGHSHNDYAQETPFLGAYSAGMESIEVDVYLREDKLHAAHDAHEIKPGYTLDSLYLRPLARLFAANGQRPFADSTKSLQLLIDLKEDYQRIMPALIASLEPYRHMVDPALNNHAVRIVLSGSMPSPAQFADYPAYLFFDGRPNVSYTVEQLKRVALISDNIRNYTSWDGKGVPSREELDKLREVVRAATALGKPFRFWAAPEGPSAWVVLEGLGVTWLNTDHPDSLRTYLEGRAATH